MRAARSPDRTQTTAGATSHRRPDRTYSTPSCCAQVLGRRLVRSPGGTQTATSPSTRDDLTSRLVTRLVASDVAKPKCSSSWSAPHLITATVRRSEFETVSQLVDRDLAYTVEIERFCAKVGGRSDASDGRVFRDAHSEGKNGEGCPSGDLGQVRETVDPLSQMSPDGVQFDRPVQCRRHGPPNPVNAGFATQHQEEHLQ
jgi:hypothetical protein